MEQTPDKSSIHAYSEAEALKAATDLLAYSSAYMPFGDEGFRSIMYNRLLSLAVTFAVNARRCIEIEGNCHSLISVRRWNYRLEQYGTPLSDLRHALNGIVHARNLSVHAVSGNHEAFSNMQTLQVHCYSFETAHRGNQVVDVFGMVWAFLQRAKPPMNKSH